jgi:hypothetical protein
MSGNCFVNDNNVTPRLFRFQVALSKSLRCFQRCDTSDSGKKRLGSPRFDDPDFHTMHDTDKRENVTPNRNMRSNAATVQL